MNARLLSNSFLIQDSAEKGDKLLEQVWNDIT
jgi:hypothetical protein